MREEGQNQLQILVPLLLREIYRMIPLSAKSISLDSLFNDRDADNSQTTVIFATSMMGLKTKFCNMPYVAWLSGQHVSL